MMYYGKRVELIRKRKMSLKSQLDIAVELGISQSAYSGIENGYGKPSNDVAEKLTEMYDLGDGYFEKDWR